MADNPHKGHRERMRNRYRSEGLDGFADHEVLELLLFYCYPQCNTNTHAHRMLKEFGSLHNLFETDVETLMSTLKCTENIAVLLNFIPALANRYGKSKWAKKTLIENETIAGEYALNLFLGEIDEKFYVLCLGKQYQLINTVLISEGTVDEAAVYLREIMSAALKNNATAVILTHNHPGGTAKPSNPDISATRQIIDSLASVNIDVLDHIIAAGDTYYSFAARRKHVRGYY
ncbi:MAG: DNA repair protein RadC [Defluviitaleaceae bacterium]|nr:DNA repair protein RadC [Defluviitaleaceae bacterium]MCL2261914.1 DNA repair protein RadC [Defluviitaleaceae bacterium]